MSAVTYTEHCRCGRRFSYELATCEIHMYDHKESNHLVVRCPRGHVMRIFIDMSWIEAAQKRRPGQRLNVMFHSATPVDIRAAAQEAWHEYEQTSDLERDLIRFGQTGQFF